MGEKLKITRKEIESLVLDLSRHEEAYAHYMILSQNTLTLLWMVCLSFPALLGFFYPEWEYQLLIVLVVGCLIGVNLLPRINNIFITLYLNRINKNFGHQVTLYKKYNKIIRHSIKETLSEGSEGNYLQKVVIKTLSKTF